MYRCVEKLGNSIFLLLFLEIEDCVDGRCDKSERMMERFFDIERVELDQKGVFLCGARDFFRVIC